MLGHAAVQLLNARKQSLFSCFIELTRSLLKKKKKQSNFVGRFIREHETRYHRRDFINVTLLERRECFLSLCTFVSLQDAGNHDSCFLFLFTIFSSLRLLFLLIVIVPLSVGTNLPNRRTTTFICFSFIRYVRGESISPSFPNSLCGPKISSISYVMNSDF